MEPQAYAERQKVIFEAKQEYGSEKKSGILAGCVRPLFMRFTAWIRRKNVVDELVTLVIKEQISPQELLWFTHSQLIELKAKITKVQVADASRLKNLFKRAICQSENQLVQQGLAEVLLAYEPNRAFEAQKPIEQLAPFNCWIATEYKHQVEGSPRQRLEAYLGVQPPVGEKLFLRIRGDGDCGFRAVGIGLLYDMTLRGCLPECVKCFRQALDCLQETSSTVSLKQDLQTLEQKLESVRTVEQLLGICMTAPFDTLMIRLLRGLSCEYLQQNWETVGARCKFYTENERPVGMTVKDFLLAKATALSPDDPLFSLSGDDAWAISHMLGAAFTWSKLDLDVRSKPVFDEIIQPPEPIVPAFHIHLMNIGNHINLLV